MLCVLAVLMERKHVFLSYLLWGRVYREKTNGMSAALKFLQVYIYTDNRDCRYLQNDIDIPLTETYRIVMGNIRGTKHSRISLFYAYQRKFSPQLFEGPVDCRR